MIAIKIFEEKEISRKVVKLMIVLDDVDLLVDEITDTKLFKM